MEKEITPIPIDNLSPEVKDVLNTLYANIGRKLSTEGVKKYVYYQSRLETNRPIKWVNAFTQWTWSLLLEVELDLTMLFGGKVDIPPSGGSRNFKNILNTPVDEKLGRQQSPK